MSLKIKSFVVGPIDVNCFIVHDDTMEGIVIDPGGGAKHILSYIGSNNINIRAVVDTHGHGDHIGANDEIRDALKAPLYIHELDNPMLSDARLNLSAYMGYNALSRPAEHFLAEGDTLSFGETTLKVIHTPGHSPGGICLLDESDGVVFVGDTLFQGSIGRTDFPGGSYSQLVDGIRKKLLTLPDETKVLTGHGGMTTIGDEKRFNAFL